MSTHVHTDDVDDAVVSRRRTERSGSGSKVDGRDRHPIRRWSGNWSQRLAAARTGARRGLSPTWENSRLAVSGAIVGAASWGVLAGWATPRGPLTSSDAIWSIVISLTVGVATGLLVRSRWAMAIAPIAFAIAFELTRIDTDGPTVDGLHVSAYGVIAFVTGRGFHALLSLLPMVLGAAVGAGAARTIDADGPPTSRRAGRIVRRSVAVLAAFGLLALTVGLARPARTDPIVDAAGDPVRGSIAEISTIDVNGHDMKLLIRGHSVDNPIVLFLAGGPGGSEFGAMRRHLSELEEHVTVATWDQRGSGTSYPELDPTDTISLDGYVADTIAVTEYLRDRFDQDRIVLLGQSWGTTLGVLAVQEHPELYRAFVGTGQMVSQRETDRIFYDDTLAWARDTGRNDLVDELESIGPPPYDTMFPYESALSYEHEVYPYDNSPNSEGEAGFSENLFVEEYALIDQVHALAAFIDTFAALYPQLQDIDFRETATEFEVPMFFVQGAHEAGGRAELFDDWYPMIDAPITDVEVLDTSGHRPLWEQPDEFVDYMVDTVLDRTAEPGDGSTADDGVITSIADALGRDGDADLAGFVIVDGGRARLCHVLMESFPPQCGDPSIEIANADLLDAELTSSQGVSWTDDSVSVSGTVTDGVLTLDP